MADVTLIHDCDIMRRGDGSAPADFEGDFRDCFIYQDPNYTNENYGGNVYQFHSGGVTGKEDNQLKYGLLRFDLRSFIPASAVITAARWWFYVGTTSATASHLFRLVRCRRTDWKELKATWNSYKDADNGQAESGGPYNLTDNDKAWTTNQWVNYRVRITGGTGLGQCRLIASNSATTLTVSTEWGAPDATSTYDILTPWTSPGASDPTYDRDTSVYVNIGALDTAGWKNYDILTLVSDAWSNRAGVCTFLMERYDGLNEVGYALIHAKHYYVGAGPTLVHRLRITYTLDGKVFQVIVG